MVTAGLPAPGLLADVLEPPPLSSLSSPPHAATPSANAIAASATSAPFNHRYLTCAPSIRLGGPTLFPRRPGRRAARPPPHVAPCAAPWASPAAARRRGPARRRRRVPRRPSRPR